jgi:hypothetical protein
MVSVKWICLWVQGIGLDTIGFTFDLSWDGFMLRWQLSVKWICLDHGWVFDAIDFTSDSSWPASCSDEDGLLNRFV